MASPVDTSVKFFRDDFPGAPVLNGMGGALIGLLTACLETGFGLRTVTSLVVSGGVATLALASDAKNPNLLDSVILVDGSSITALNGEQRVTFASSTELKFATAAADGTATGSITVKTAPAGWEKKYIGTNLAAYRSLDPLSKGTFLQVNDANPVFAVVRGYEAMSDVSTGTGAFPTMSEAPAGGAWQKAVQSGAGANRWDIFADTRIFYFCPAAYYSYSPTYTGQAAYWFGDVVEFKSGDAFSASLSAARYDPAGASNYGSVFVGGQGSTGAWVRFARSYTGLGSAVQLYALSYVGSDGTFSGSDSVCGRFPAPTDGALRLSPIRAIEGAGAGANSVLRGDMPGAYHVPQTELYKSFQRGDRVTAGSKRLYAVQASGSFSDGQPSDSGRGFFDITGPWR